VAARFGFGGPEPDEYSGLMDPNENVEQVEVSELPASLIEQARAHPGGSVAQIDGNLAPNPNGFVPPEAIIGAYEVGDDGALTGIFRRNPRHGHAIVDDWSKLESSDHWLGWLPGEPGAAVRQALEETIGEQVPGSVVEWVKVTDDPVFLTGGPRPSDNPDQVIVRRAALAIEFALSVLLPSGKREVLVGSFSWVAVGLDGVGQRRDRTWFDIGMPVARAGELLEKRIWEPDA